jgi:Uma2 family endonuclease
MGDAARKIGLSSEEYLALERGADERHEYADGEIFAMSGGTIEHSTIAANIIRDLGAALFGRRCRVVTSDMRIHLPATGRYVYPDAAVVCGRPRFLDDKRDTLLNPALVVEILSDSTEAYDRGDKFAQYRSLESFRTYVLASQKEPRIEVFLRQPDEGWLLRVYGPGERAALPELEASLDVERIYQGVLESAARSGTLDE